MSRSYEYYREDSEIDWFARNMQDQEIWDGLSAEPQPSRFEIPPDFVPDIPKPVRRRGYSPFSEFTAEDWNAWYINNPNERRP